MLWDLSIHFNDGTIEHRIDSYSWCLVYLATLKQSPSITKFKLKTYKGGDKNV